jgi:ribosomal protein L35AE/L33A
MNIDFNQYSLSELRELNQKLVAHIKLRHERESQARMVKFTIGDRVCFESSSGELIEGEILRFNKKSVTIETNAKAQWRVAPQFLSKVVDGALENSSSKLQKGPKLIISE